MKGSCECDLISIDRQIDRTGEWTVDSFSIGVKFLCRGVDADGLDEGVRLFDIECEEGEGNHPISLKQDATGLMLVGTLESPVITGPIFSHTSRIICYGGLIGYRLLTVGE